MLTSQFIPSNLTVGVEKIYIGFSGGKDSHVLLHLLSSISNLKSKIIAVYIHHGLQQEADQWDSHCEAIALACGVAYQCIKVDIQKQNRQSQEELAREARYSAFKSLLTINDVLLLAQHREDQLETILLQLFRGAGVQGLAGMSQTINFGKGRMIRPLLDVSQVSINEYAKQHHLQWIEDLSNQNNDFNRNFLRNKILPQIKQRWPALDKTVTRAARHCANSHFLNADLSKSLLNECCDKRDQSLNIQQLLDLDVRKQQLVIRQWFGLMKLRMPSEKTIFSIVAEVLKAKQSANPEIKNKSYCIRRYRNKLYCFKTDNILGLEEEQCWAKEVNQLQLNNSILTLCPASTGISQSLWHAADVMVKFRKSSEKIKLPHREGRHTLKKLFQEKAIPPWERALIPLIYLDDKLAAIADLWVSADFIFKAKAPYLQIHWTTRLH